MTQPSSLPPSMFLLIATCAFLALLDAQAAHSAKGDAPISMDDYLLALERIAPAARAGAVAYRDAYERRCRRVIDVGELRRLVADGSGDPVLMAMISASHRGDQTEVQRMAASIVCRPRN